ncbi:hypothetical protein ABZY93_08860 [Streptomyces smyrnaeus]|uniref:hypothetical protein n=1 Tax=Streptomyces smyrnaeus TaxID=1387713 RepID=UPI0033BA3896
MSAIAGRLTGPVMDNGDGTDTEVGPMADEEYLWDPVPECWSVRWRVDGPGPRATPLADTGDRGRGIELATSRNRLFRIPR